jgi:hypothetical protein
MAFYAEFVFFCKKMYFLSVKFFSPETESVWAPKYLEFYADFRSEVFQKTIETSYSGKLTHKNIPVPRKKGARGLTSFRCTFTNSR